jgi:chromosome segregation ATPase
MNKINKILLISGSIVVCTTVANRVAAAGTSELILNGNNLYSDSTSSMERHPSDDKRYGEVQGQFPALSNPPSLDKGIQERMTEITQKNAQLETELRNSENHLKNLGRIIKDWCESRAQEKKGYLEEIKKLQEENSGLKTLASDKEIQKKKLKNEKNILNEESTKKIQELQTQLEELQTQFNEEKEWKESYREQLEKEKQSYLEEIQKKVEEDSEAQRYRFQCAINEYNEVYKKETSTYHHNIIELSKTNSQLKSEVEQLNLEITKFKFKK